MKALLIFIIAGVLGVLLVAFIFYAFSEALDYNILPLGILIFIFAGLAGLSVDLED